MAVHDTIGDFLTIIRNASMAKKEECTTQVSKMRLSIAKILKQEGFISDYSESVNEKGFKQISLKLKYVKTHQRLLESSVIAHQVVVCTTECVIFLVS